MSSTASTMAGKAAVITGGAAGIGFAVADAFATAGARLVLIDKDESALIQAQQRLVQAGATADYVVGTIGFRDATHRAFDDAVALAGQVDILVNNAGLYVRTPIEEITDEDWDQIFDVCLRGLFHMSVAAVKHMRGAGSGRIVNIASVDGLVPFPPMAHYAAAKAGVISLTKTFGLGYVKEGILVNGVAPGAIDTPPMRENDHIQNLAAQIPLGRGGSPEEIAAAVMWLASDANTYCVGETLVVSGGLAFG